MRSRLDWERDGRDWPNREASSFVRAAGMTWHVQRMGPVSAGDAGRPTLLLVHGTAAATHSWRDLMPALAAECDVIACDLPGHGFTEPMAHGRPSLHDMARALADLLAALDARPDLVVGHSAGAALLVRMALDRLIAPAGIVSLNGALMPFDGMAGRFFSPLAKMMALNPFVPRFVSASASDRAGVERLIRNTGSSLDERGVELYRRLVADPGHVQGALAMMAHWDLDALGRDLPKLATPLLLVVGDRDKAVSPEDARRVRRLVRHAEIRTMKGAGHLAHEERPQEAAELILGEARVRGLFTESPG
ncbi:alpha/beta fold hydrolase BchO [Salinarimonas ramus]|uniref:Alpha/beta hydrolase n=1 Tax=Salinarimonas ramus TaxID=690164 RepID=A0A917Q5S6_9HYPH|nr:alpha/beta fold hydrolase BchO [Salinarimonas ramus]GGK19368.1 alpha/beta hydrolase [Salinarimonas ramus]